MTTFYHLICSVGNILHVYEICDENLSYDVTTNVFLIVPEDIVFPSIDLHFMDSWNWSALSLDITLTSLLLVFGMTNYTAIDHYNV